MNCEEYRDWVAADVDGVLTGRGDEVRQHLERCAACRAERERQLALRDALHTRALRHDAPLGLRTRILAALDEASREEVEGRWWPAPLRWLGAVSVAVVALAAIVLWNRDTAFSPLIRDYDQAASGRLAIAVRTSQPQALEDYYRGHAAEGIPSHVIDLSPAGFRLLGGTLADFPDRRARLAVYSDGQYTIVCDYRFAESFPFALPATGEPVFFHRGGANFCARRMGNEVCLLVTRMPMEIFRRKVGGGG